MNEIVRFEGQAPQRAGEPMAVPRLDKPFKLTMCVTATCNMDCKLCYADCNRPVEAMGAPEMSTSEWKGLIDHLIAEDFIHIFFEGGEPFYRPDFEELLAHIDRRLYIAIRTHGHMIDRARAERLKAFGVARLYVDLFAAIPEIQDELTGTPGCYDKIIEGIKHARAVGIKVTILAILSRKNHDHIQRYLDLAKSLDCDQVGVLRLYPLGRAKKNWAELSLSLEEMMTALNTAKVPPGVQMMQSWHPRDGNCCWQNAAVSPTGDSIGCPYLREYVNYGNVRDIPFVETWNNQLYQQLRSNDVEESCAECSSTQGTHGGCRSTAYAFHGRFTAPDPYCINLNKGVDLRVLPQRLLPKDA
jgi:radical SAM protein with 4Fe4S-binding SPASM domain